MPTLTAMFKDPPNGLIGEAWGILRAATDGKQLLPGHVQAYCKRHVARWEREESHALVSDSAQSSLQQVKEEPLPLGSGRAEAGTAGQDSGTRWTRRAHGQWVPVAGAPAEMDPAPSVSPGELAEEDPKAEDSTSEQDSSEPDWEQAADVVNDQAADAVNDVEFRATPEFRSDLDQIPDEATACVLEESREQQELRRNLLPSWLQSQRERPDVNQELAKMRALKEAGTEQVRWRSLRAPGDMLSVAISSNMRQAVRTWALTEYARTHEPRNLSALTGIPGVPGSANAAEPGWNSMD